MSSSRIRLYLDLKLSPLELSRWRKLPYGRFTARYTLNPARYLKEMTSKWSIFEKPYLDNDGPRAMNFQMPTPDWPLDPKPGFGGGTGLWIFRFAPGLCWITGRSEFPCGESVELRISYNMVPPGHDKRFNFKAWSDRMEVPVIWVEQDLTTPNATIHIDSDDDYDGPAVICGESVMSGAIAEFIVKSPFTGETGILQWQRAMALPPAYQVSTTYYQDYVGDCGCTELDIICCDDSAIAWDDANSGDTIARNSSCNVAITDNGTAGAPYNWSVTGTGYWFDSGYSITSLQTSAKQVTLYADNTACGTATVTITGCGGNSVYGEVRGTTGQWIRRYCRTGIECPGCGWPCAKGSLGGTGCTDWGGSRCCLQNGGTAEGAPYGPNKEIIGKYEFWHYWKCQNGFGSDTCCCGVTDAVSNRCNTCLPLATRYMGNFYEWIC